MPSSVGPFGVIQKPVVITSLGNGDDVHGTSRVPCLGGVFVRVVRQLGRVELSELSLARTRYGDRDFACVLFCKCFLEQWLNYGYPLV